MAHHNSPARFSLGSRLSVNCAFIIRAAVLGIFVGCKTSIFEILFCYLILLAFVGNLDGSDSASSHDCQLSSRNIQNIKLLKISTTCPHWNLMSINGGTVTSLKIPFTYWKLQLVVGNGNKWAAGIFNWEAPPSIFQEKADILKIIIILNHLHMTFSSPIRSLFPS